MMSTCFRKAERIILAAALLFAVLAAGCRYADDKAVASFSYEADDSGFYDLVIEYENPGDEGTLGLFINDKFFMKVDFPSGNGTVTETVTLKAGKGSLKFCCLPGDGDIKVSGYTVTPSEHHISLVVAPHEDDEILAFAGTIQQRVAAGDTVKVVFLTTGDFFDADLTAVRIKESVNALALLGVDKTDIYYLGYGDLSVQDLYECEDPRATVMSYSGYTSTHGDPSSNMYDYHTLATGSAADYTYDNLRGDLYDIIDTVRPDAIYTTSGYEWHPDHSYAFRIVKEIVETLNSKESYHTQLCESVVHGEDDWPGILEYDDNGEPVLTGFTDPFPTMETDLDWDKVTKITLTEEESMTKLAAIYVFDSQNNGGENYDGSIDFNCAFCRSDEFYWVYEY